MRLSWELTEAHSRVLKARIVRPNLDVRFQLYNPDEFQAVDMQLRTTGRMKQDPNAGLM